MPAVAEQKKVEDKVVDLANEIGDSVRWLAEIREKFDVQTLTQAWLQGVIELSRRLHICDGVPLGASGSENSKRAAWQMRIEEGMKQWIGVNWIDNPERKARHKRFPEIVAEDDHLPECSYYRLYIEYVKMSAAQREKWTAEHPERIKNHPTESGSFVDMLISRDEAWKLIRLQIRLSDKGLALLQR